MLEFYFKSPKRLERLRCGPLAEHIADLAAKLHRRGFTRATGQRILSLTGRLNGFAAGAGVEEAAGIDDALAERFINEELRAEGTFREAGSLLRHMLEHLRSEGVIQQAAAARPEDGLASVLGKYDRYLDCVRGLSLSSRSQYVLYARRLIAWWCERHGERPLAHLSGVDVLDFITELAGLNASGSWRNNLCSLTRVFLRYLRWEGIVEVDLDRVVPTLPHWRLQSIPRHLPWAQVRTLIDSVDTSTPLGLRDRAVLLSIATLGLRNQEVRNLKLTEIHWRAGEIRLAETKGRRERALPLLQELGSALAEYVAGQRFNADRPEAHTSLGLLYAVRGDTATAETEYRKAQAIDPSYVPAWVNLADLQRARGDEEASRATLLEGLDAAPGDTTLRHALGLSLARTGDLPAALKELEAAARAAPQSARYTYVYAIALHSAGREQAALRELEQGLEQHPANREFLLTLASIHLDAGRRDDALQYLAQAAQAYPRDPEVTGMLQSLRGR